MAKKRARVKTDPEKLYHIVEKLRAQPKESSQGRKKYNFSDPTALQALRIHRHLRALEDDILEHAGKHTISLNKQDDNIVISIRNDEVHCCRVAYLSKREFGLLRKNRKVANVLRRCPAYKDVA